MALTFGTLLSSQGAGAHRYWASRPVSGQLAKRYSAGFAVSNPEVWPHHPHITLGRGIRGVGGMGARPVRRSTGVRGVEHGRRAVAVESNPLSPLSRTAVRCPRRLSSTVAVEPAGRPAVEHGPGRNRPQRPHFARPERTGQTRADPEAVTTVRPDRTRRRRHELPPAVRRSDARHHSGGSATETNIRPSVPTDDRHRMFPAAGSGRRGVRRDTVLVRAYLCWRPDRSGVPAVGPRCDRPVGLSDRRLRYPACTAGRHRARRPPERVNPLLSAVTSTGSGRLRSRPAPRYERRACRPVSRAGCGGHGPVPASPRPNATASVGGPDQVPAAPIRATS